MKRILPILLLTAFLAFGCCEENEDGEVTSPFLEFFKSKGPIQYLNIPAGGYTFPDVPEKFKNKKMPEGYWTDPEILALGKRVYNGEEVDGVACKTCHGETGTPLMTNARDFRDPTWVNGASDAFWFWRVWDGVEDTPMAAWGEDYELTEKQVWAAIAYEHTFHKKMGKPTERELK
ncbi:MAG: c-type cytochrome [Nitrospinae bacterium]|nr:c-type cytochrome [Nitrospinota bacterium]